MSKKPCKRDLRQINSLVIVSDIHAGCGMGLMPPEFQRDEGQTIRQSAFQAKLWEWWMEFWDDIVPKWTRGEPYATVFNGDALDGVHHNATTQVVHNLADQQEIAYRILEPIVERCEGRYYHIRGTEAHVGKTGAEEEKLARRLEAIPDKHRHHARWQLWKLVGSRDRCKRPFLGHFLHHIGTTGSQAYESTAVMKEMTESYTEAGRWNRRPPDFVVRSHRHRALKIEIPTANIRGISMVTPAWQGKTPFVWKLPGGRLAEPQIGGRLIRVSDDGELYERAWVQSFERDQPE